MQHTATLPRNARQIGQAVREGAINVSLTVYQRGAYYYAHNECPPDKRVMGQSPVVSTQRRNGDEHTEWMQMAGPAIAQLAAKGEVTHRSGIFAPPAPEPIREVAAVPPAPKHPCHQCGTDLDQCIAVPCADGRNLCRPCYYVERGACPNCKELPAPEWDEATVAPLLPAPYATVHCPQCKQVNRATGKLVGLERPYVFCWQCPAIIDRPAPGMGHYCAKHQPAPEPPPAETPFGPDGYWPPLSSPACRQCRYHYNRKGTACATRPCYCACHGTPPPVDECERVRAAVAPPEVAPGIPMMAGGATDTVTHTPGPWYVERATPQSMRRCELGPDGWQPVEREDQQFLCILADSDQWQGPMPPYGAVCAIPAAGEQAEPNSAAMAEANARLIAAAPDLLYACQKALEWLDNLASRNLTLFNETMPNNVGRPTLRAAIAAAEGK